MSYQTRRARRSIMGETVFHLHIPIREALSIDDATLLYFMHDAHDARPVEELRTDLVIRLAKGHTVLPITRCSNFDPVSGCRGHASDEIYGETAPEPVRRT